MAKLFNPRNPRLRIIPHGNYNPRNPRNPRLKKNPRRMVIYNPRNPRLKNKIAISATLKL